jgi:hypothetical protein
VASRFVPLFASVFVPLTIALPLWMQTLVSLNNLMLANNGSLARSHNRDGTVPGSRRFVTADWARLATFPSSFPVSRWCPPNATSFSPQLFKLISGVSLSKGLPLW